MKSDPHPYIYQRYMNTAAIIQGKYKFMTHENGEELLFDVSLQELCAYDPDKDLHEAYNLISRKPEKANELRNQLAKWKNKLSVPHYEGGYHDSLVEFINQRWGFINKAN